MKRKAHSVNKNSKGGKKQAKLKDLNTRVKVYEATVITMIQTEPIFETGSKQPASRQRLTHSETIFDNDDRNIQE